MRINIEGSAEYLECTAELSAQHTLEATEELLSALTAAIGEDFSAAAVALLADEN